ncbi:MULTISPECIES: DUF3653 domain-containing protein [Bacteria]|uniref:DUF3653 domain-containing protein n=1 Tax=Bacteria TaxID=2 RepID=UPI00384FBA9D
MRDRNLTGPWAGFAFKGGRLVTPEGRELEPQDLAWLGLTAALAQEWRKMMAAARCSSRPSRKALPDKVAEVVDLRSVIRGRTEKPVYRVLAGSDAEPTNVVHLRRGPKPRKRV